MPNDENKELAPLGFCNFRNQKRKFGIKLDDRRRHVYVVGKTGVGKTTLLENMVISDVLGGHGLGVIDPHGEFAERIVDFVPEERLDDIIYFNPADMEYPFAFNPIEQVGAEFRHLVASGLMGVFKKIFVDVWSARMAYILNNTLLALLEIPGSTLLGVMRMLSEPVYRKKIVEGLKDPVVKAFWVNEFARYTQRLETEAVAAIQNKIGQFVSNPLIRNILGQAHSSLNMREVMDKGKILVVNLSKGKIGEDNSALLGAMIITRLQLAAMSRMDVLEEKRRDFFLYVDEFQNFATEAFANILSEARKYRLSLILAHQYIGQLVNDQNTKVRDAVFGNVGTIICFRVGGADAEFLEKEFMPEFVQNDLVNLGKANVYAKLMIDGVASRPFSAETLPSQKSPLVSFRDVIVKNSREHYGTPRKIVEDRIAQEWETTNEALVAEKIGRRGERPMGEVGRQRPEERRSGDYHPSGDRHSAEGAATAGREPRYSESSNFQEKVLRPSEPRFPHEQQPFRGGSANPTQSLPRRPDFPRESQTPPRRESTLPRNNEPELLHREPAAAHVRVEPPQPPLLRHTGHFVPRPPHVPPRDKPKQFSKPGINIEDLRKAISESLAKTEPAPDEPKDSGGEPE